MWTINGTYCNQKQLLFPDPVLPLGETCSQARQALTPPTPRLIQTQKQSSASSPAQPGPPRSGGRPAAGTLRPAGLASVSVFPRCAYFYLCFLGDSPSTLSLPRRHLGFQRKAYCGTECSGELSANLAFDPVKREKSKLLPACRIFLSFMLATSRLQSIS